VSEDEHPCGPSCGGKQVETHSYSFQTGVSHWADAETCLPVLMEIRYGSAPQQYFVTMSNFELDLPLDPAIFSMAIPEGYTVEERSMNMSPPTEARAVRAMPPRYSLDMPGTTENVQRLI
jgi:hypothetical protein